MVMENQIFQFIENGNNSFRIHLEFKETYSEIIILQHAKAWYTKIEQDYFKSFSKEFKIEMPEYYEKIKESLLNKPENVEFNFIKNEFVMHLKVHNGMKIKYFNCKLHKTEFSDCTINLIEKLYEERNALYKKCLEVEQNQRITCDTNTQLENKLRELTERKATEEQELYDNFVLVLNEKKKRVQHLCEQLEAFRRGRPTVNSKCSIESRKTKIEKQQLIVKKEEILDSDHSNNNDNEKEYSTDEEKEQYNSTNDLKGYFNEPVPSTSKASDLLDNSPPRHLLPKRIKRKQNDDEVLGSFVSSASKVEEHEKEISLSTLEDNSPNIGFNTQDLLDDI